MSSNRYCVGSTSGGARPANPESEWRSRSQRPSIASNPLPFVRTADTDRVFRPVDSVHTQPMATSMLPTAPPLRLPYFAAGGVSLHLRGRRSCRGRSWHILCGHLPKIAPSAARVQDAHVAKPCSIRHEFGRLGCVSLVHLCVSVYVWAQCMSKVARWPIRAVICPNRAETRPSGAQFWSTRALF